MTHYILLLLVSSTLAINATSPLFNNDPFCARNAAVDRGNPRPTDCLNLATFILATTSDRSQHFQFSRHPSEGQMKLPYTRGSGTCVLSVIITTTDPTPDVLVTSSFDDTLRNVLDVVGVWLLNNSPEAENFGGVAKVGVGDRLTVGIYGTRTIGGNGETQGNEILNLVEIDLWMQSISQI